MTQSGRVDYSTDEMMTVAASHELEDRVVCFVGIGLPSEAANLARDARAELLPDLRVRHSGRQTRRPSPQHFNTTVVGPYDAPKVRPPGAGGAPEIAASAREVIVVLSQTPRAFVERLDFVTSVGYGRGGGSRGRLGYHGAGPTAIITDLGILRPDPETREFTLVSLHPGATVERAREATGWDLEVAKRLDETESPTGEELEILRDLQARTEALRERPKS